MILAAVRLALYIPSKRSSGIVDGSLKVFKIQKFGKKTIFKNYPNYDRMSHGKSPNVDNPEQSAGK
jgi:hypothetical protein